MPEENADADGEDKDDDDDGPSGFGHVEDDIETEEDPPEWEMGIRRSNQARVSTSFYCNWYDTLKCIKVYLIVFIKSQNKELHCVKHHTKSPTLRY